MEISLIISLLWFLMIVTIIGTGQLYLTEKSRKMIIDAIERGNPVHRVNLPFFQKTITEFSKVVAVALLIASLGFWYLLIFNKIYNDLPSIQAISILLISFVLQVIIILLILRYRKRNPIIKGNYGYMGTFLIVYISGQPIFYYKIIILFLAITYLIETYKILFLV